MARGEGGSKGGSEGGGEGGGEDTVDEDGWTAQDLSALKDAMRIFGDVNAKRLLGGGGTSGGAKGSSSKRSERERFEAVSGFLSEIGREKLRRWVPSGKECFYRWLKLERQLQDEENR